jgi:catechol 2,3-dioxygenase-like lactoylglutathione lyase family enzyme
MRRFLHSVVLFTTGAFAGHLLTHPAPAQDDRLTGLRLNHFGIAAKDWNQTLDFYTKTLGFKEAFTFKDKDGNVTTSYIQMSRENFVEVTHANATTPVGVSHIGIWVDDLNATVRRLRDRGVKVDDPRTGNSRAPLTNFVDPNGIRIELLEYPANSMQRKAIDAYR